MTAGAPGAFGSLVIFNSSGVRGSHSSPAPTGAQNRRAATPKTTITSKETRVADMMNPPQLGMARDRGGPFTQKGTGWHRPGRVMLRQPRCGRVPSHGLCYRPRTHDTA